MADSHNPLPPDDVPLNDIDVDTTIDKTAILRHMMNLLETNQNLIKPKNETNFSHSESNNEDNSVDDDKPKTVASKIESCSFLWDIRCSFILQNTVYNLIRS